MPSGTIISTPGSHQPNNGGGASDGFFVQFYDCLAPPAPTNITPNGGQKICATNSTTLVVNGFGSVTWYTVPSGGSSILSGSVFPTNTLAAGTYTYYAEAATCTNSAQRVGITVTVNPLPSVTVVTNNTLLCEGLSATLSASGVNSYTWNTGANGFSIAVNPTITTNYTVTGTDFNGCSISKVFTQSVTICTGVYENADFPGLKIFPNPANEFVTVQGITSSSDISLINTLGQEVFHQVSASGNPELQLGQLAPGIYYIRVQSGDKTVVRKLVKQ